MNETFGQFLLRRFHEEALAHPGKFRSITEFGKWLGVKQSTFSMWCNDTKTPESQRTADLLAEKLGVEVYDALGMARRMPKDKQLNLIALIWHKLPPDKRNEWYEVAQNIADNQAEGRTGKRQATD